MSHLHESFGTSRIANQKNIIVINLSLTVAFHSQQSLVQVIRDLINRRRLRGRFFSSRDNGGRKLRTYAPKSGNQVFLFTYILLCFLGWPFSRGPGCGDTIFLRYSFLFLSGLSLFFYHGRLSEKENYKLFRCTSIWFLVTIIKWLTLEHRHKKMHTIAAC